MAATSRLYGKRCIVNACKTVQVASNGVTMRGISYHSLAVDYFQGAATPRKKVASVCMTHSEEPRVVFGSRMKQSIQLAILRR